MLVNRLELVFEALDPICAFFCQQVFKELHAIIATLVLAGLIIFLVVVPCVELVVHICHLLVVSLLVRLQRFVHLLALVYCVLLDVFDLPVEKFE